MNRWYYGWTIVAVAFITQCITTGIVFYSFGVFLGPLCEHFGWSRAETSFGFSLVSLCGALYAPFVGRAVDRYGPRPAQLVGAVAMACGFLVLPRIERLSDFYLLLGVVVSLGATALGTLPSNAAVASWFVRLRGRALGISTAGISMGGVVFVPLTQFLIDGHGWRGAFARLGWIIALVSIPPVLLFMRKSPESMGLHPDGDGRIDRAPGVDLDLEIERSWTVAQALRHRNFWLVTAAFALTITGLSATLLHQIAFLADRGFTGHQASWALGATAGIGVLGKLGFGWMLERLPQQRVILACFGLQVLGVALLAATFNWLELALYVVIYGFAMGGNATLQATVIGDCFGRMHYGSIAGRMTPFIVAVQALSIPLAGAVRDRLGTYVPAFALIGLANVVAMMAIRGVDHDARPA